MVAAGTLYLTTVFTTFSNASHHEDTKGSSCDSSAYKGKLFDDSRSLEYMMANAPQSGW